MASGDNDIKQRIAQLAGQINRHKNQAQSDEMSAYGSPNTQYHSSTYQTSTSWRGNRGSYAPRGRGYARGRARIAPIHRNRTLVLNNSTDSSESASSTTPTSWVSKSDRHLQLINPAIYEKQSQERTQALEVTRKRKLQHRDQREKLKLARHLQRASGATSSHGVPTSVGQSHELLVQGIRFTVEKGGSRLMKVIGDGNAARSTPKIATIGGVTFYRSKNGNLYRSGVVKAQRRKGIVKKIDEPCKTFSTTGSCQRPGCPYNHDPTKVAICKDYLQKGTCPAGDSCDLSHDPTPERTPACLHFVRGNCSNDMCRYSHIRVSPAAQVCRAYAIYGYCSRGSKCSERHVTECPDFSNSGTCSRKGCKLPHRIKASVIRKNTADSATNAKDDSSDLSSDEDADEIDSEDVDSDDLEFLGDEDIDPDTDIPLQQDYVQL